MNSRIEKRREALSLTQEDVARMVGVTKSTVSRWESGTIKEMRRDKLATLATALNTSIEYLLELTDNPDWRGPYLSPAEKEMLDRDRRSDIFSELASLAGFIETVDEDANVTIYDRLISINCTPELVDDVMKDIVKYFTFLLKEHAARR